MIRAFKPYRLQFTQSDFQKLYRFGDQPTSLIPVVPYISLGILTFKRKTAYYLIVKWRWALLVLNTVLIDTVVTTYWKDTKLTMWCAVQTARKEVDTVKQNGQFSRQYLRYA